MAAGDASLVLLVLGVALFVVAGLVGGLPVGYCAQCPHCRAKREEKARRQKELAHNLDHKGGGWQDNDPDIHPCLDESCPRNPKVPVDSDAPRR